MLALVIIDTVIVLLLAGLVAGLLRSHADILRALHALGAGVGDPATESPGAPGHDAAVTADTTATPLHIGPPLAGGRHAWEAHDIDGTDPRGDAVAVAVTDTAHLTLVAFLSSGCSSCAGIWSALGSADHGGLPADVRAVVVTKGADLELPAEVRRRASPSLTVVMSSRAWDDYEVPGSPFFVLVDGRTHRRVGEGVARHFSQVVDLVRRARADAGPVPAHRRGPDGQARQDENDSDLIAAGIHGGHPSLYPSSLDDVFAGAPQPAEETRPER